MLLGIHIGIILTLATLWTKIYLGPQASAVWFISSKLVSSCFFFYLVEGKRHDSRMLHTSGLLLWLQQLSHDVARQPLCIYGDQAYPLESIFKHLIGMPTSWQIKRCLIPQWAKFTQLLNGFLKTIFHILLSWTSKKI